MTDLFAVPADDEIVDHEDDPDPEPSPDDDPVPKPDVEEGENPA